jgi:hypothetical protein
MFLLQVNKFSKSVNLKLELNSYLNIFFESLILAQDERWRCALGMQVERSLRG